MLSVSQLSIYISLLQGYKPSADLQSSLWIKDSISSELREHVGVNLAGGYSCDILGKMCQH